MAAKGKTETESLPGIKLSLKLYPGTFTPCRHERFGQHSPRYKLRVGQLLLGFFAEHMQRESWDLAHPQHLPLLLQPSSSQQKTTASEAPSIILVAEKHKDNSKRSSPGERMNDWTYLPGSCGVFVRRVEMPGTAGDTRVTRPVVTNLQGVNSFIALLSFLLVARQPLSARRPPPSPMEADIHETEVRRQAFGAGARDGTSLVGRHFRLNHELEWNR